ncbi:MAG: hypothetical protein AB4368_29745, partial [Xenococcaceae cyanobacterium]
IMNQLTILKPNFSEADAFFISDSLYFFYEWLISLVQVKRERASAWHCVIVNLEDRQPQAIPDLWKEKTPKEKLDAPKDNLLKVGSRK